MGQCKICKTNGITMLWDDTCGFCLQKECEALRASMGRVYCVKRMAVLKTLLLEVKGCATLTLEQLDRIDAALNGKDEFQKKQSLDNETTENLSEVLEDDPLSIGMLVYFSHPNGGGRLPGIIVGLNQNTAIVLSLAGVFTVPAKVYKIWYRDVWILFFLNPLIIILIHVV